MKCLILFYLEKFWSWAVYTCCGDYCSDLVLLIPEKGLRVRGQELGREAGVGQVGSLRLTRKGGDGPSCAGESLSWLPAVLSPTLGRGDLGTGFSQIPNSSTSLHGIESPKSHWPTAPEALELLEDTEGEPQRTPPTLPSSWLENVRNNFGDAILLGQYSSLALRKPN